MAKIFFFTPHERRALIFLGAVFFCGICLDITFKCWPTGYSYLAVLDTLPARPKVDINRAPYEALVEVPGIGPSVAARIIYKRQALGGFSSLEDLRGIKGFSKKMQQRAAAHLTVGAP